jgi:hypothetical protein
MTKSFLIVAVLLMFWAKNVFGGTLDGAPFRIALPNSEWVVDDSKAKDMGNKIKHLASITNTNSGTTIMVYATNIDTNNNALSEVSSGFRDSISKPGITNISEKTTEFVGHKARLFSYERKHEDDLIHNVTVLFVVDSTAWSVLCVDYEKDAWTQAQKLFKPRIPNVQN